MAMHPPKNAMGPCFARARRVLLLQGAGNYREAIVRHREPTRGIEWRILHIFLCWVGAKVGSRSQRCRSRRWPLGLREQFGDYILAASAFDFFWGLGFRALRAWGFLGLGPRAPMLKAFLLPLPAGLLNGLPYTPLGPDVETVVHLHDVKRLQ